jgi:hypothetical protein
LSEPLHIFAKTKSGGVQQVVVKHPSDTHQIMLIREHMSKISQEFTQGNFSDPARIHGNDMPGPCRASLSTIRNDRIRRLALASISLSDNEGGMY